MIEAGFTLRAVNSLLVATGDLLLLRLLFAVLGLRHPGVRRVVWLLAIGHAVAALALISPLALLRVALTHDGGSPALAALARWDRALALGAALIGLALVGRRALQARAGHRRLRMLRALSPPAPAGLVTELARQARRAGVRCPDLLAIAGLGGTPFVVGPRRPLLVFPLELLDTLTAAEVSAVLAHELAHVRRGDLAWRAALELVGCALWFNPVVGRLIARYRHDTEALCDADACLPAGPRPLAHGLAKLGVAVPLAGCPADGSIEQRLRRLARPQRALTARLLALALLLPLGRGLSDNPARLTFAPGHGGAQHHATLHVSAGWSVNPLVRWLLLHPLTRP